MKKTILIAAVMFFALSVSAFAQATFTVGSVPVTYVACCGQTEKSGDVSFTMVYGSPNSVTGTMTVTYPVFITNTAGPLGIQAVTDTGNAVVGIPLVGGVTNNLATGKGQVVITLGAGATFPTSFRLIGVRLDVSGMTSGGIMASVSSTYNLLTAGETSFPVVENIAQALVPPPFGTTSFVSLNAVTGVQTGSAVFRTDEGFLDAFGQIAGAAPVGDPTQNISKMIRIKLSTIPAGVTLTFPQYDNGGRFQLSNSAGTVQGAAVAVTSLNNPVAVYYRVVTSTDPAVKENFTLAIGVSNTTPYPKATGTITATAHIAPIDSSLFPTLIPRYADLEFCETAPVTLVSIFGSSTTLLIPYAQFAGGYDTGIAIANTTTDPGVGVMTFAGAVKQNGKIKFYMYPQLGGTPIEYETAAGSPGVGLDATTGELKTGQLYTVGLSEILAKKNVASFSGYIFVVCGFTNAHGEFFLSDYEFFTHGALMLVVNNPSGRGAPEALNN